MKKLIILAAFIGSSLAQAAPFIFPKAWTVSSPTEISGGTYSYGDIFDYKLNPFAETISDSIESVINPRGLFIKDPISGDALPYMAESYSLSSNKLIWTVKLRPELKWSDGRPITGQDWVTTAKIHTSSEIITNRRDRFFIEGKPVLVSSPDSQTVVFEFPKVVADAIDTMSIVPWASHILEPVLQRDGFAGIKDMWGATEKVEKMVSAGAFKLSNYEPGVRIVADKNPFFAAWNVNSNGVGLPYLNRITRKVYKDRAAYLTDYLQGSLDQFETTLPNQVTQLQNAIGQGTFKGKLQLNAVPQTTTLAIFFNWNKSANLYKQALFRNANFRLAMSYMMNRQAIVKEAYGGLAKVAQNAMTEAFGDWRNPELEVIDYNLEKTRALLARIGYYQLNNDGLLVNRDGQTIDIDLVAPNTSSLWKSVIDVIQRDAKVIGIKINPQYVTVPVLLRQALTRGKNREFDMIMAPLTSNILGSYPLTQSVYSCKGQGHTLYNASGECLDPLETQAMVLYERGRQTLDLAERKAIVYKIQEVEQKLQPLIHLAAPSTQVSWQEKLQGEFVDYKLNGIRFPELSWLK